ncbi:MAG: HEAT repeat domain-containing protein [Planctomycetes bacterium]|nr:HEAT repeat domain-containing protein [Planctomycetota bacterium]
MTRRPFAIAALSPLVLAGCGAPSANSADSMDRIEALHVMGRSGHEQDVPKILPSLSSEDPLVRWTAQRALITLTGTTNGYDWAATRADRASAIDAWVKWCKDRGLTPPEAR